MEVQTTNEVTEQKDQIVKQEVNKECAICKNDQGKYRCPGCEKMFCSLDCSKKHKTEWNCSGKRDKTKFIPIKYYSEQNMWDDIGFLEEVAKQAQETIQNAPKVAKPRSNNNQRFQRGNNHNNNRRHHNNNIQDLPKHLQMLIKNARRNNINLQLMPAFMSKRKTNTTIFDFKREMILWRIEWIFDLADNYLIINDKVEDIKTIGEILSEHLMKPEIKEKLAAYENTPVEEWRVFMKAERSPRYTRWTNEAQNIKEYRPIAMEEISSFFEISDLVGTIIGILASSNEVKTILNIGIASKRHNEYLHSQRLWQNFHQRVFYNKSTEQISSNTIRSFFNQTQIINELPLLKPDLFAEDREKQFRAAEHLRKLLIQYPEGACNAIVQHRDLLPRLVHLLDSANDNLKLQYETCWILTNVAASLKEEHTRHVIEAGAVVPLLRLFKSDNLQMQEQCAWALSNIIADHQEVCNELLNAGVIDVIINVLKDDKNIEAVRTCAMFYRNICRRMEYDSFRILLPAIPHIIELIMKDKRDMETCNEVGWALTRLWTFNNTTVYELLQNRPNAIQTLIKLMKKVVPAIRLLGNFLCGTVEQTRAILDLGFLAHAKRLLQTTNQANVSQMLWALSNITTEFVFVQEFKDDGEILPLIVTLLKDPNSSVSMKSEALWILTNAMEGILWHNSAGLYEYFLGIGVLEPFYKELNQSESKLTESMLEVLAQMLKFEQNGGVAVKAQLESWGLIKLLKEMSDDYELASEILRKYFPEACEPEASDGNEDDDDEDQEDEDDNEERSEDNDKQDDKDDEEQEESESGDDFS